MKQPNSATDEQLEIELLLLAIHKKYGYDFRQYSPAHTRRRLEHRLHLENMNRFSEMIPRVLYEEEFFTQLLLDLSINTTEMFRDPWFYRRIREVVIPHLQTYPFLKIWHAGCSAGQEVYSMCILLQEEGLKERCQVYATDFNDRILARAKDGIYPMDLVREYSANYLKAGGTESLSEYYTAEYNHVVMKGSLKQQVLFSSHNLATDGVFGEMHMICCRNVLIYFTRELQNRVLELFFDSLCPGGFLCLGSKESIKFSSMADNFEVVCAKEKIFRKKRRQ
nr:protein-glutamate O-methyltransferase CheR [uncultured Desulfobulbus sp.]